MFNSSVLDVAIGMVFVYLLLSLMCSAASEIIEVRLKNRSKDLEKGLRELLQDADGKGLVSKIYQHPLVSSLFEGNYTPLPLGRLSRNLASVKLPSYIPARTFALVLMDTVLPAQNTVPGGTAGATTPSGTTASSLNAFNNLRSNLSNLENPKAEQALRALIDAADNDVAKARENIEKWFDSSMDRVSGWYKRRSQIFVLILGFFVAVGVNADSVLIAQRLSADKALRETVVSAAQDYAKIKAEQSRTSASPAASPSASPTASPSASPAASPKPTPSVTTGSTGASSNSNSGTTARPSPSPSTSPSPSPSASPDACAKDPKSAECRYDESFEELKRLALPIGWDSAVEGKQFPGLRFWTGAFWSGWTWQFRVHILGWLLTALAVSLGAPFWFDLLNKFIVVRSTVKPKEKSPEEKSKD